MPDIYEMNPQMQEGTKVLKMEFGDGIRVYLEGHPHPHKGYPNQGSIDAINTIKKMFLLWPFISLKTTTEMGFTLLKPFVIKPDYMTSCARELRKMISNELGVVISHIIEYDSAYRFRLQHMLDVTYAIQLANTPQRTLTQMLKLNRQNDYDTVHKKIQKFIILLRILLLWPPFKRKWKHAILNCDFKALQTDAGDRYWLSQRTDYGEKNLNPIK